MTRRRRCGPCGQFVRVSILLVDGTRLGWEHRACARLKGMAGIVPAAKVGTVEGLA